MQTHIRGAKWRHKNVKNGILIYAWLYSAFVAFKTLYFKRGQTGDRMLGAISHKRHKKVINNINLDD